MIQANCWSDDRCVEVAFDATPWFEQAKDKQILALARCGWRGDYAADAVSEYLADFNSEIAEMYTYIRLRNNIETIGFECAVSLDSAKAWLAGNRPKLLKKILKAEAQ